jgi:hypothetical protein
MNVLNFTMKLNKHYVESFGGFCMTQFMNISNFNLGSINNGHILYFSCK